MKQLWRIFSEFCPYAVSATMFVVLIYFARRPPTIETLLWWITMILAWILAILVTKE